MDLAVIRIVILASSVLGVYSLNITNLSVPDYVQNGTEESILLDCEYDYEEQNDTRLVVKWFHNENPTPVYQWIPEIGTRHAAGKFVDRINTNYEVTTGDELTKYRALNILRPTTEMSGKYECHVSSTGGYVSKADHMIIYAIPTSVSINVSSVDDVVYIICMVEEVYPVPEIEMFHIGPGEVDPVPVDDVYQNDETEDDAFNVILMTNISESELRKASGLHFFGCIVTLPGTEYKKETKIPYFAISRGYRPGQRRKIQSDASMLDIADPEVLDLQTIIVVAAQHDSLGSKPGGNDENGYEGGAFYIRPSVVTILIFVSALLVLPW